MDRYNSVNNTKNDFRIAFWKLYQRLPIEKISVSELCRVAGYNRTTFYVYYDNIYDLLNRCIEEMIRPIEQHVTELSQLGAQSDKGVLERLYLTILKTHEKRIHLLIEHHQLYLLEDKVKTLIKPALRSAFAQQDLSERDIDYMLEYQLAAGFGVVSKWFHDQDMTDEEIVKLLVTCSQQGVVNMLHSKEDISPDASSADSEQAFIDKIIGEIQAQNEE